MRSRSGLLIFACALASASGLAAPSQPAGPAPEFSFAEPTAGWIIYTSDLRLVDGSTLRMPHTRVRGADGADMERHPRPVDAAVSRPVGETLSGKDSQLDEAIRNLLKKLGRAE